MKKVNLKLVQTKDEINPNPSAVGQASYDILSKPQAPQEVGETIEAMTPSYYQQLLSTVKKEKKGYTFPFYVVVLRKKEPYTINVLHHWFVARQTRPSPRIMREDYPNHDLDLWLIKTATDFNLEWVLPTKQDSDTILKNKDLYSPSLVEWICRYRNGELR